MAFPEGGCPPPGYGVLIRLSPGCPPVAGRLHTCYAPVRRSPPVYCYTALPLDLHVLGLPLAFILSQDQTLHCIQIPSRGCPPAKSRRTLPFLRRASTARPVCCTSLFNDLSSSAPPGFPPKADAKVRTFHLSRQTFPHVFLFLASLFLQHAVIQRHAEGGFFCPGGGGRGGSGVRRPPEGARRGLDAAEGRRGNGQ